MIIVDPRNPKGIVWLASYPRSGNTWARAFLNTLFQVISGTAADAVDLDRISDFTRSDDDARLYERYLGRPVTEATHADIAALRPRVHKDIFNEANGTVLVKTHNAMVADGGHPMINQEVSAGAIYLVRNPFDVAVSLSHFRDVSLDQAIADMGASRFGKATTDTNVYMLTGSWSENVASWTAEPHSAVLVIRYEDLLAEPTETFGAIAGHVLMRPTPEQLREAIERCAFDRLKEAEQAGGFKERPPESESFFREGRSGQGRERLSEAQIERIIADHGDVMRRFGYLPL